MRTHSTLLISQTGAPFLTPPGNGRLPSLRQWIYFLVGGALLLTAERPYFRLAASRGWIASGQQFTTDRVQDWRSAYWAGRRHSLKGMFQ